MTTTTEKGFKIPGYADKADVPGMVKDNVETAEHHDDLRKIQINDGIICGY